VYQKGLESLSGEHKKLSSGYSETTSAENRTRSPVDGALAGDGIHSSADLQLGKEHATIRNPRNHLADGALRPSLSSLHEAMCCSGSGTSKKAKHWIQINPSERETERVPRQTKARRRAADGRRGLRSSCSRGDHRCVHVQSGSMSDRRSGRRERTGKDSAR
jgi:hypothetical protein